jgi:hypothetical protein
MALSLPPWYKGGFIDVEDLLCDLFIWLLGEEIPVVTWLVEDYYVNPRPVIRVHRAAGKAVDGMPFDHAVVQIGVLSQSRQDSWQLAEFVRQVMAACSGGFKVPRQDGTVTQINSVEEWAGPVQALDEYVDDKFISINYRILVRNPRSVSPDYYRQIMNTLPS